MTIKVNGETMDIAPGTSIQTLMESVSLKPKLTAVQLNGRILPHEELVTTVLSEGDAVEFIRVVGGG